MGGWGGHRWVWEAGSEAEVLLAPLLALLVPCGGALRVGGGEGRRLLLLRLFLRKSGGGGHVTGESHRQVKRKQQSVNTCVPELKHLAEETLFRWAAEVRGGSSSLFPLYEELRHTETKGPPAFNRAAHCWGGGAVRTQRQGGETKCKMQGAAVTGGEGGAAVTDLWSKKGVELEKSYPD